MSPDPADRLIQAVRAALRELSDASGGAVELRQRQQRAHVELWTALESYERATAARAPQEGRAGS